MVIQVNLSNKEFLEKESKWPASAAKTTKLRSEVFYKLSLHDYGPRLKIFWLFYRLHEDLLQGFPYFQTNHKTIYYEEDQ